jgi:hypothetical protein
MDAYRGWRLSRGRPNALATISGLVFVLLIGAGFWTALAWFGRTVLDAFR